MKLIFATLAGLLSAGWLAPLYFALDCYLHLFGGLAVPRIREEMNSFPYQSAMMSALTVSFLWLGLVIIAWSAAAAFHLMKTKSSEHAP